MDVINGLLRIKRFREGIRQADMRHAGQQFEVATQGLRRVRDEQQRRDRERAEREQSLYQDVCSRVVVVRDLNDLNIEVDTMKNAAKTDAKAVVDAQELRQERRRGFDVASDAWRLAALAAHKFETFSEQEREAADKHKEYLADLELEEYTGRDMLAQAMQQDMDGA